MPPLSDPVTPKEIRLIATETGFSEMDLERIYLHGHQPGPAMRKRLARIMHSGDERRFFIDGRSYMSDSDMAVPLSHESNQQGLPPDGYDLQVIPANQITEGMLLHADSGPARTGLGKWVVGWITVEADNKKDPHDPDGVRIPTSAGTVFTHRHQVVRVAIPK